VALSLEISAELVTVSSYCQILGGEMTAGQATLTMDSWVAMGVGFGDVSGRYMLATPTDSLSDNEKSGVWFVDNSTGLSQSGLVLPELPSGWEYEGWVDINGTYLSTGKFMSTVAADDSNSYGGEWSSPAFPGEDLLFNAPSGLSFPTDLAGTSLIITLEPWDEYDVDQEAPFYLKLLEADVPVSAAGQTTYYMSPVAGQFPGGTASVE
jgi:hypothetical protein